MTAGLIVLLVLAFVVLFTLARSIRIVPQARAGVVERLGRYYRTLEPGLALLVPYVDRVRPLVDLREQVVSFPPQPVITEDNLTVNIDSVIYYQVTDPKAATYEISNYIQAIEQLTVTTLRNVIGGMTLEQTLTSRDEINSQLRIVLDEATGKWGIRANRVELKSIDPPGTIQEAMEKQMRAERDRRAAILQAEGVKQSQILTAEGEKQSSILRAEGQRESQRHPRGRSRSGAAGLPVPADAAADRPGRREQGLDHPQRDHQRAGRPEQRGRVGDGQADPAAAARPRGRAVTGGVPAPARR
jgi:regulator of protease activity HflC (stomatin/prohibitin superfamily)